MEWQHWLDPVGQYIELIVAVKSQFVFAAGTQGGAVVRGWLGRDGGAFGHGMPCPHCGCGGVSLSGKLMTDGEKAERAGRMPALRNGS
jgi:hypothetical protein